MKIASTEEPDVVCLQELKSEDPAKLAWFARLIAHAEELMAAGVPAVLAGDKNIVPIETHGAKVSSPELAKKSLRVCKLASKPSRTAVTVDGLPFKANVAEADDKQTVLHIFSYSIGRDPRKRLRESPLVLVELFYSYNCMCV